MNTREFSFPFKDTLVIVTAHLYSDNTTRSVELEAIMYKQVDVIMLISSLAPHALGEIEDAAYEHIREMENKNLQ